MITISDTSGTWVDRMRDHNIRYTIWSFIKGFAVGREICLESLFYDDRYIGSSRVLTIWCSTVTSGQDGTRRAYTNKHRGRGSECTKVMCVELRAQFAIHEDVRSHSAEHNVFNVRRS